MVVQCPNCQTKFRIADEKVTDKGVRVRCTSCKNVFQVRKSGTEAASSQAQSGTTQELQALQFGPGGELLSRPPPVSGKPGPQLSRPPRIPAPPLGEPPEMAPPPIRPPSNPLLQPVQRPSAPPPALSKPPPPVSNLPRPPGLSKPPPMISKAPPAASLPRPPLPTQPTRPPSSPSLPRPALVPPPARATPSAAPPPRQPAPGLGAPRASLPVPPPRPADLELAPPANGAVPSAASAPGALGRRRPSSVTGLEAAPAPRPSAPPNRGRATADDLFGMDELTGDMSAQPGSPLSSNPNLARLQSAPPPPPPESVPPPPPIEDAQPPLAPEPENSGAVKLGAVRLAVRDPLAELAESISGAIGSEPEPPQEQSAPPAPVDPALLRPVQREMVAVGMTGLIGVALALAVGAVTGFINPPPAWMREGTVQPVIATQIASGLYDVSSTKPVFFIRGRIENHGVNTVGAVQVVADLIGNSGSVARVEAIAGSEPTAEDIHAIKTAEDVEAMAQRLAKSSAGKLLSPGESEPFFALIADPPIDAERDELRLNLAVTPLHR